MLDLTTIEGADAWGHVKGRAFAETHKRPAVRFDALKAWGPDAPTGKPREAFVVAFVSRAAAELAGEAAEKHAEQDPDERKELASAIQDTLGLTRRGSVLERQEAAWSALRNAIRYGFAGLAQSAAERLCHLQGTLQSGRPGDHCGSPRCDGLMSDAAEPVRHTERPFCDCPCTACVASRYAEGAARELLGRRVTITVGSKRDQAGTVGDADAGLVRVDLDRDGPWWVGANQVQPLEARAGAS